MIGLFNFPLRQQPDGTIVSSGPISAPNINAGAPGKRVVCLGNSIGRAAWAPSDPAGTSQWLANQAVTVGATRFFNHFDLRGGGLVPRYATCTVGGTTGAVEPIWGDIGTTQSDGTAEWQVTAQTGGVGTFAGYWHMAQALAGQPLDETYLIGFAGAQYPTIMAYLTDDIIESVDIVFFGPMWENDVLSGNIANATARWADFVSKADSLRARGKIVCVQTVLPMKQTDYDDVSYVRGADSKVWEWLNRQIRKFAADRADVVFCDVANLYINMDPALPVWPDQTTQYVKGDLTTDLIVTATDKVHPDALGHFMIAKKWAPILEAKFGRREVFGVAGEANQWDRNPLMYGTGGELGTNVTGVVATNQKAACSASASAVASKITGPNSAPQRLVISTTAAGQFAYLASRYGIPLGDLQVGDWIQVFVEVEIAANPVGFAIPRIQLAFNSAPGTGIQNVNGMPYSATTKMIGQAIKENTKFVLKTLPVKLPSGTVNMQVRSEMYASGSVGTPASVTADFHRFGVSRPTIPALS